jgi:hypothetical protein
MTPPIIRGSGFVEKKPEREWQSGSGYRTIRVFEGTEEAINALIPQLQQFYNNIRIMPQDGPVIRVEAMTDGADDGADEKPEDTWELLPGFYERSVFETTQFASLPAETKIIIKAKIDGDSEAELEDDALIFYTLFIQGMEKIPDYAPVLRHTQTVSRKSVLRTSLTNIRKVILPASIQADSGVPDDVLFTMPADTNPSPSIDGAQFVYGWLKTLPTVTRTSYGKYNLTQEWNYGLYPTFFFATV